MSLLDAEPIQKISLRQLAKIYGISAPSLLAASKKLQLRMAFMENPLAVRSWMIEDGFTRGKLRRIVFDEDECKRIIEEVDSLRYANAPKAN